MAISIQNCQYAAMHDQSVGDRDELPFVLFNALAYFLFSVVFLRKPECPTCFCLTLPCI